MVPWILPPFQVWPYESSPALLNIRKQKNIESLVKKQRHILLFNSVVFRPARDCWYLNWSQRVQNYWFVYSIRVENIPHTLNYEALERDPKPNPNISPSSHPDLEKLIIRKQLTRSTQPVAFLSIGYTDVGRTGLMCLSTLTESK